MTFPMALVWRQWTVPSLRHRRFSRWSRALSKLCYRVGARWGDALAQISDRELVEAMAAGWVPPAPGGSASDDGSPDGRKPDGKDVA